MTAGESDRAGWLLNELFQVGYDCEELIGQMMASLSETGLSHIELITIFGGAMSRTSELMNNPDKIWEWLVPGNPADPEWKIVPAADYQFDEETVKRLASGKPKKIGNVKLDYGLTIHIGDDVFYCPNGAEFFMDEHGVQWVKYFPTNGPTRTNETIVRTDSDGFKIEREAV
jgi:hypothetical protein